MDGGDVGSGGGNGGVNILRAGARYSSSDSSHTPPHARSVLDRYTIDTYEPWCCCPFSDPEAVGYVAANSVPVGVVVMSNIFIQAAILELANRDAGCGYRYAPDADDDPPSCKGTT